jgi:plastocyanin
LGLKVNSRNWLHLATVLVALLGTAGARRSPGATAAGAVEGQVHYGAPATRRVAAHYLGGGASVGRKVQPVPPIVFLTSAETSQSSLSPETLQMAQRDTAFSPAVLIVDVGTTLEFPNQDPFFHNVFSYSAAKRFDLGRYPRGESRSVRFDEPGIVKIYCEVHDFMRAVVVVADHPYHTIVREDGRFSIRGVPSGRHRLTVWHPEQGSREVEVVVTEGGTTRVDVKLP